MLPFILQVFIIFIFLARTFFFQVFDELFLPENAKCILWFLSDSNIVHTVYSHLCIILQGLEKKSGKEKKKGKPKNGETNSFIPLFREPSSIEKIFGDFEREQHIIPFRPPIPDEQRQSPPSVLPRVASPRAPSPRAASPRVGSPRAPSPRPPSPRPPSPRAPSPRVPSPKIVHHHKEISYRPEPTLRNHHASATKIQAAYRGYTVSLYFVWLEFKTIEKFEGTAIQENLMATASLVDILIVSCVSAFYCVPYLTTVYLFSYDISEDFSSPKSV